MAKKKLISLKSILENEEISPKVDENDDADKKDEISLRPDGDTDEKERANVKESGDEDGKKTDEDDEDGKKTDESEDDAEKKDEEDSVLAWQRDWTSKKPPAYRTEGNLDDEKKPGETDQTKHGLDDEAKQGETDQTKHGLDDEGKPGQTLQADKTTTVHVKEDEEKKDENDDEVNESDDDLLLDESEDADKKDEISLRPDGDTDEKERANVKESGDEEKTDENDDEEKVDEAILSRMFKALKVNEAEQKEFKDILSAAVHESARRIAGKAVKRARVEIVREANDRIRTASKRKVEAVDKVKALADKAVERFKESHKAELKKLAQFDEMTQMLKGVTKVIESFGLSTSPDVKKLKLQLENERKANAKREAELADKLDEAKETNEEYRIAAAVERMTKSMTESDKGAFISIVSDMKVEGYKDFVSRAEKVRAKLFKENGKAEYDNYVEALSENKDLVSGKVVTESEKVKKPDAPKRAVSTMEAATRKLQGL